MPLEENKAIVRRWIEAYNKRDLALLDDLMKPDFFDHTLQLRGLDSFKQFYTRFFKGFPDTHATIDDIAAEGDKVWSRSTVTGTHTGEYRGISPAGKKITFTGIRIWRIVDGKVVERTSVYDFLDLHKKLGVAEYKRFPDEVK